MRHDTGRGRRWARVRRRARSDADARGAPRDRRHPLGVAARPRTTAAPWVLSRRSPWSITGPDHPAVLPQRRHREAAAAVAVAVVAGPTSGPAASPTPPGNSATWSGRGWVSYIFALLLGTLMVTDRVPAQDGDHVVPGHAPTAAVRGRQAAHRRRFRAWRWPSSCWPAPSLGGGLALAAGGGSFSNMLRQVPAVATRDAAGLRPLRAPRRRRRIGARPTRWPPSSSASAGSSSSSRSSWGSGTAPRGGCPSGAASAAANVTRGRGADFGSLHAGGRERC